MSEKQQHDIENELISAYMIFRRLKCVPGSKLKVLDTSKERIFISGGGERLFPRRFLLKVLDERLTYLNELAREIINDLFKGLRSSRKSLEESFKEIDHYFHNALYDLYDFFIDLDWHEGDILGTSEKDISYARSQLPLTAKFILFARVLQRQKGMKLKEASKDIESKKVTINGWYVRKLTSKATKSSLSEGSSAASMLSKRRRVRFDDIKETEVCSNKSIIPLSNIERSVFAWELLIYALSLLIYQLAEHLVDIVDSIDNDQVKIILESKKKIRTQQLISILKQIKMTNDLYLISLEYIEEFRNRCLQKNMFIILSSRDSETISKRFKEPILEYFNEKIGSDIEMKIILRLIRGFLRVFADLLIADLNLPPIELGASTRDKTDKEVVKNRENVFNFLSSWLRFDDYLFGVKAQKRESQEGIATLKDPANKNIIKPEASSMKTSTLAQFTSSSRILNQMDNIAELLRDFVDGTLLRLKPIGQKKYFIEVIYSDVCYRLFDQISSDLSTQQDRVREIQSDKASKQISSKEELSLIRNNVDYLVIKTRCIKFIHIMNLSDRILKSTASKLAIPLEELGAKFETTIAKFIAVCGLNQDRPDPMQDIPVKQVT